MTRSTIRFAAACGASLLLAGAALPASAAYLGYGNGDPANWDYWTEQRGGRTATAGMQAEAPAAPHGKKVHHAHHQIHHSAKDQKAS